MCCPDGIGVQEGCDRMRYGEVERKSNEMGDFVERDGLERDEFVGVCMND